MTIANTSLQRLYLFPLSFTTIPLPNGALEMVSASYLIQTQDHKNILIDTGVSADYTAPSGTPSPQNAINVLQWLDRLGLMPANIDMVICTHFDVDHVGYNDSFANTEIIVQREQYEIACSGHPRYAAARLHWAHPSLNYRLIEGDTELLPGLKLLKTSGHAPGHQSVLIRLPQTGVVLLAIDAVVMKRLFTTERRAWPTDDNEDELRVSTQKLLDVVASESVSLVVFGHDGTQWKTLKTAPPFYN